MPDWLKLYHRSPYFMKVAAASGRGLYLRYWRYGAETERLVAEATAREAWTPTQWESWRTERLAYILQRAATQVPYYREQWAARRRAGDRASWEYLENWPVLKKQAVRAIPDAFVADDLDRRRLFCDRTSGTTGTPLPIWLSRSTVRQWYALLEARSRRWYGTSYRDRWAILGGQLIADVRAERPPYWVHNFGLNQLYLSAFHIKPSTVAAYLKALRDFGATHIICYPSALFVLAKLAEEQGLQAPQLRFVYTNAEAVLPSWRATIQRVFQCPLQSTYGMTEIALAGSECVEGNIHLWPETGILEIFDPQLDQLAVPGEAGRYIITGLLSPDMLFIRYEIGDWGKGIKQELCACGRLLPIFDEIGGRIGNQLYTPDGRAIFWANNIFGALHIQELQVVQEALDCLRVNVVPAADYSPLDHDLIVEKLHQRVGYDTRVEVVVVKEISRGANGKFQPVVSKLT